MVKEYDYLIVGSGLYGSVFAHEMKKRGKSVLVIERRSHIAGNIYTEKVKGIDVHKYGPHIFHTDKRAIWDYVESLVPLRQFVYSPIANYHGELYNMPFNMHTFYAMWGTTTPEAASKCLEEERAPYRDTTPENLEQQALKLVGPTIYEKLVKGYTEKQWGRPCRELPAFIIRRLPVRFNFDNNYFNDRWQGIPEDGYTALVERLLDGIEVKTDIDFLDDRDGWREKAERTVFTGCIDEFFGRKAGALEYRSLRFEEEELPIENFQGVAGMNYTAADVPYTRITEHKHFLKTKSPVTIISREYPRTWKPGLEPYYPVNDEKNSQLYEAYCTMAREVPDVIFGGRLGTYRYLNMDQIIENALHDAEMEER